MAIIKCPECGKEISDKANICPNCAYPLNSTEPQKKLIQNTAIQVLIAIPIGIFILIMIILINSESSLNKSSNNDYVMTIFDDNGKRDIYSNDFSLIEEETTGINQNGIYTITGKVKQNIDGNYNGLMLSFIMYDENYKEVRKTSGIIISNYEGNGIWSFSVSGNDADNIVKSFEMEYCYGMNN